MGSISREELKKLAELRFSEAKILFSAESYSGSYYICGYAVEMALKAVIARQFRKHVFPDKALVGQLFQHNIQNLCNLAGLSEKLRQQRETTPQFDANWSVVVAWTPEVRYELIDPFRARSMMEAVGQQPNGVLEWLKTHW